MPGQYAPREQGILYQMLQQPGMGQKYQGMPTQERLGLLQGAMQGGQQASEQDLEILNRLRALREEESAAQIQPQLAPANEGPGFLGSLFQFFTGRQAVDPLGELKRPGYSGPRS